MSILGYSANYFLPEYWRDTPLYGEKILPLLDYVLSTDFVQSDKLADAFYMIQNKYKNTADLPLEAIKAIIDESGYSYVMALLGEDEESIRLLVYLLVLIHQLKGTSKGIELVLALLKKETDILVMGVAGTPSISTNRDASGFSLKDYVTYSGFTVDSEPFELPLQFRTSDFKAEQTIISASDYGFLVGINTTGNIFLNLGSDRKSWNIVERATSKISLQQNTNYFMKLGFDGFEYTLALSTDGVKYSNVIVVSNNTPTAIHNGILYIGVDRVDKYTKNPFRGTISLATLSVDVSGINIIQWFERFPVGAENTFIVKAELDIGLISSDFFENFSNFVKRYVYPTLESFEAKLAFRTNLTFIPYARYKVRYVGHNVLSNMLTIDTVPESHNSREIFWVRQEDGGYEPFLIHYDEYEI